MSIIDSSIIIIYLCLTVAIGIGLRGKQENLEDYFEGGGHMSGPFLRLVVGLSLAATLFSGISFVATPSVAYQYGPAYAFTFLSMPVFLLLVGRWFLPLYLKSQPASPYAFLEARLGHRVRHLASALFLSLRLGWMAALIYAPTLIILSTWQLDSRWFWPVVLLVGLSTTIYTVLGGIRGVIFTDALQFVVIFGGIIGVMIYLLGKISAPLETLPALWEQNGHSFWPNMTLDPTQAVTFWTLAIGSSVAGLSSYMADQMSLQRYIAIGDVRSAQKAFTFNIISAYTVVLLLIGTGLLVFAWYQLNGSANLPEKADQVFPYFIATELPSGLVGMLMAAVLAATMSSMTSGINALASCVVNDFFPKQFARLSPPDAIRSARLISLAIGLLATFSAGLIEKLGTIFDMAQIITGTFLSPVLGAMLVAALRWPVSERAMIIAMIGGILCGLATAFSSAASLWVPTASLAATLLLTLLLSSHRLWRFKTPNR